MIPTELGHCGYLQDDDGEVRGEPALLEREGEGERLFRDPASVLSPAVLQCPARTVRLSRLVVQRTPTSAIPRGMYRGWESSEHLTIERNAPVEQRHRLWSPATQGSRWAGTDAAANNQSCDPELFTLMHR